LLELGFLRRMQRPPTWPLGFGVLVFISALVTELIFVDDR
jgi:hypothetical protein